jgi:hypothetical protein
MNNLLAKPMNSMTTGLYIHELDDYITVLTQSLLAISMYLNTGDSTQELNDYGLYSLLAISMDSNTGYIHELYIILWLLAQLQRSCT